MILLRTYNKILVKYIMEDCNDLKAQIEKKGLSFTSVRPISVKEVQTKIKKIKDDIIKQDLAQYGHLTDKQIKEAMGLFLHDNNYYINKGGAGKKNKTGKNQRHKKSRKQKQSRRRKQTIRQTI